MAKAKALSSNPASALADAARFSELRSRLLFLIGALIVYRIGTFIPVPGIDPEALARFFEQQQGTILSVFNMFSVGALERLSIFALGIMPYISASIIMQMMAVVVPSLAQLKKEGESGRRKITQYTRYGTVGLATFQSVGAAVAFQNQGVVIAPGPQFVFTSFVSVSEVAAGAEAGVVSGTGRAQALNNAGASYLELGRAAEAVPRLGQLPHHHEPVGWFGHLGAGLLALITLTLAKTSPIVETLIGKVFV